MTTELVGYKLRNVETNEVIASWGGIWGQCPSVPALLEVPQGMNELPLQVCAPKVGDTYGGFILETWMMDEPPPAIVPLSRRQFYQQLALAGFITQDEALAAMSGTIPASMVTLIETPDVLPDDAARFTAKMLLSGASEFDRTNPLVGIFGAAQSQSPEQLDAFWRAAALL